MRVRWSPRLGWVFFAVVGHDGRRKAGPTRLSEEEAAADYVRMKETAEHRPVHVLTLEEAIERHVRLTEHHGATPRWVKSVRSHGRYLLKHFGGKRHVATIRTAEISGFIRAALQAGRHANTLIEKDLPILAACFRVAGLSDQPVKEARQDHKRTLKKIPPRMEYFHAEEARELLHRMRHGVWRRVELVCRSCRHAFTEIVEERTGPQERPCPACRQSVPVRGLRKAPIARFPSRERDADLVELLLSTGVRPGELGRVRVCDVDLERKTIRVVSKDRSHPRDLRISELLEPVVRRLHQAAGKDPGALLVPDSMNRITNLARRWKRRLGEPRLKGRTCRHTLVTGLLEMGVTVLDTMGLAGHRRPSTTDRYAHEIDRRHATHASSWSRQLRNGDAAEAADPPSSPESPPPTP